MNFVPGSSVLEPSFGPEVTAHVELATGSFVLMIFAAAPVPPVTLPVTASRVSPVGHLPFPLAALKLTNAIVVPLPPFQVSVSLSVPFVVPLGGFVKLAVPPALRLAGVHFVNTAAILPALSDVVTVEHDALAAAPAGDPNNPTDSTMAAANNLAAQVEEEIRTHFQKEVFKTVIPRNVRLSESPSHGKPILLYDASSKGCQSYLELAREVVERVDAIGRAA